MRYGIFPAFFLLVTMACAPADLGAQQPAKKNAEAPAEAAQTPESEERLSLETNQVLVNVTVTDLQENYVPGLKAKDFQIFEDRQPQRVVGFSFEETPFAAAILFDTSGSMGPKLSLARAACSHFAARIREGDSVAIYTFGGTKVTQLQDFTEVRDVDLALWETKADGETPLYDAVVRAAEDLTKREEKRRVIVVLSDGADTKSRATLEQALRQVTDAGILVYAVDMSEAALGRGGPRDTGAEVLKTMAAKSGGRFFPTPGGDKLRDAFAQTVEELRRQYTLAYEPTNEKRDGKWRTIEVRVTRPALKVRARQGYYSPKK
jgi:Ca-activated chloride channel homolog